MSLTPCPYCDHRNEEDAKFCSGCGGALGLPPHLSLPTLAPGWTYYPRTTKEIRACLGKPKPKAAPAKPAKQCSAEERILGFSN